MADKLTQEDVLALMRDGWSCINSHGNGYWLLQKGEPGHGVETKRPHGQTMNALYRKKLIKPLPYEFASFRTIYVLA